MKKRFLAIFIVVMMLFSQITVFATGKDQASVLDETDVSTAVDDLESVYSDSNLSELIVLEEITELRESNVKHFKLSNGLNKAVAYSQPVHYMNESGDWIDIDNSLSLQGNEYSTNNKFEIKFANKSGSSGLLSIKDGDYKIDFTPLNTNKVNVVIENPQENNSRKFDDVKALKNLVSKATYSNIYNGIDIEYILTGNNIKENIIVNSQQESYVYSFELKLNKLIAELSNGSIILSDSTTGEEMYVIPAPYMYDVNGVMSTDVEYSLVQNNKWKYTFTVIANTEWINADDRVFPVTIDPTIIADVVDTDTFLTADNYNNNASVSMIVGNFFDTDIPGFIKFNTLPNIPSGSVLIQSKVAMYLSNVANANNIDFYIGVYKATQNWIGNSNFTYNNSTNFYASTPESSVKILGVGAYEWDITSLYKQWKNGIQNYGLCVKAVNLPANENAYAFVKTIESAPGYVPPQLELTYIDTKGVEDYYGLLNTSLGTSGESYVNLYNGSLTYINNLTTIENQVLPYEINMVYNSIDNVWKPSYSESIKLFEDVDDGIVRYIWEDSDGTIHCFAPYLQKNSWGAYVQYEESAVGDLWSTINSTTFYPEDDIDYVLTKTTNGDFILKNYDGTQKYFDSSGKLLKICDAQGNVLFLSYENGNLSLIDCKTNNNEIIAQASFSYENDNLVSVYNYTNKLEVSLSWGNNGLSNIEYNEIDDTKDNIVNISYITNSGGIYKISDTLASKYVNYTVNTNGTISAIKVYNSSDALQSQYNIVYNSTNTVCTYLGTNTSSSVEYTFDERGRNASVAYDDSILPDDDYYDVEYSQNIYNQGGNLIKYDMTTGKKDYYNIIEQDVSFDLSNITTGSSYVPWGDASYKVCKIKAYYNELSEAYIGSTGFLTGSNTLIMSAHGVFEDFTNDGIFNPVFPTRIEVIPGCEDVVGEGQAPFGVYEVTELYIEKEYYQWAGNTQEKYQYDWAVCVLDENVDEAVGWFDLIIPDENILNEYAVVYGYQNLVLYRSKGQVLEFQGEEIKHQTHTEGGMSGGPTFLNNLDYQVFGIHVAGERKDGIYYAYAKEIDLLIYTLVDNLNSMEQE